MNELLCEKCNKYGFECLCENEKDHLCLNEKMCGEVDPQGVVYGFNEVIYCKNVVVEGEQD